MKMVLAQVRRRAATFVYKAVLPNGFSSSLVALPSVPSEVDFLSSPVTGVAGKKDDCCLGVSRVMETHSQPANGNAGPWTLVMSWVGGVWKGTGGSHPPTPMQLESDKTKWPSIRLRDS